MIGRFAEVCRRRCLTVNADKSKVMLLGGGKTLCEVSVERKQLENVSEFMYSECAE